MKFGHELVGVLQQSGWPQPWIDAVVPYKRMKKQIKQVETELKRLGFHTVQGTEWIARYAFLGDCKKLETHLYPALPALPLSEPASTALRTGETSLALSEPRPLTLGVDSSFFGDLGSGVSQARDLQIQEVANLTQSIRTMGQDVAHLASLSQGRTSSEIYCWRDVLALYIESELFFSSGDQCRRQRTSSEAKDRYGKFSAQLEASKLVHRFRKKESHALWIRFMRINKMILQSMEFQELNSLAVVKILKRLVPVLQTCSPCADLSFHRI